MVSEGLSSTKIPVAPFSLYSILSNKDIWRLSFEGASSLSLIRYLPPLTNPPQSESWQECKNSASIWFRAKLGVWEFRWWFTYDQLSHKAQNRVHNFSFYLGFDEIQNIWILLLLCCRLGSVHMVTYILTWLSACINPIIYCLTNRVGHYENSWCQQWWWLTVMLKIVPTTNQSFVTVLPRSPSWSGPKASLPESPPLVQRCQRLHRVNQSFNPSQEKTLKPVEARKIWSVWSQWAVGPPKYNRGERFSWREISKSVRPAKGRRALY